jgi:hypothetical protein
VVVYSILTESGYTEIISRVDKVFGFNDDAEHYIEEMKRIDDLAQHYIEERKLPKNISGLYRYISERELEYY